MEVYGEMGTWDRYDTGRNRKDFSKDVCKRVRFCKRNLKILTRL